MPGWRRHKTLVTFYFTSDSICLPIITPTLVSRSFSMSTIQSAGLFASLPVNLPTTATARPDCTVRWWGHLYAFYKCRQTDVIGGAARKPETYLSWGWHFFTSRVDIARGYVAASLNNTSPRPAHRRPVTSYTVARDASPAAAVAAQRR